MKGKKMKSRHWTGVGVRTGAGTGAGKGEYEKGGAEAAGPAAKEGAGVAAGV